MGGPQVADKRCDNGHFIDESWDLCPYCSAEGQQKSAEEPVARPRPAPPSDPDNPRYREDEYARPRSGVREPASRTSLGRSEADEGARRFVVGWMIGLNGSIRGESFAVRTGRNVLGRSRSSDVCIQDEQASAHHADLVYRPEEKRYILMDHNSTNGTYVNGVEIEPRRDLLSRDIVTIGSHRMLFLALSDFDLSWDENGELR